MLMLRELTLEEKEFVKFVKTGKDQLWGDEMKKLEQAIAYFEDAIKESDEIIFECSEKLQKVLTEQKKHFEVALKIMKKWNGEGECKYCKNPSDYLAICQNQENKRLKKALKTASRWLSQLNQCPYSFQCPPGKRNKQGECTDEIAEACFMEYWMSEEGSHEKPID